MKRTYITLALLLLALVLAITACGGNEPPAETQGKTADETIPATEAPTEKPTEAPTQAPTDPITEKPTDAPTEPEEPTEAPTEPETEPPRLYRDDWDPDDPENPYYNLIEVGKSYDGTTTCYDGRYDFGYTVAVVNDVEFNSVQDAIDYVEGVGGAISIKTSLNICLSLYVPDDDCTYRIFYNFHNIDFVFNRGMIYDDCNPNDEGVRGFCYYSDLETLDGIGGLDNTYVWIVNPYDRFEPGRYLMIDEFVEDDDWWYMYNYQRDSGIDNWEGLPNGEVLP